jgi:hypothetical protein
MTRNQWFTETIETIRTSINPHISTIRFYKTFTAELHLTKSQHVDYHIFGNILIRDYLNFNTTKVSFIFLKDNILPLSGIKK